MVEYLPEECMYGAEVHEISSALRKEAFRPQMRAGDDRPTIPDPTLTALADWFYLHFKHGDQICASKRP